MQRFLRGVDQAVINLFFRSDWTSSTLRQYPDGNLHSTKIESWHRYSVCLPSNGFSWPYSNLALLCIFRGPGRWFLQDMAGKILAKEFKAIIVRNILRVRFKAKDLNLSCRNSRGLRFWANVTHHLPHYPTR